MKIEVTAFPRAQHGSGASRRLRVGGRVPGIIYGAGRDARNVEVDHHTLLRQLKREAFHASILDLTLDGERIQVLLRDYQMHPWRQQVMHVDFQRVDKNRKIRMEIPLHFINARNELDIQCLPDDLPEFIEVDLSNMELNQTLHVNELVMPKGVEAVSRLKHENPAVVSVHVPKEIVIEEEAAAAPVTEIIGEVPVEGAEGAETAAEGEKKEAATEKKEPAKKEKE